MTFRTFLVTLLASGSFAAAPAAQTSPAWQDVIRNLRHPNPDTRLGAIGRLNENAYTPAAESVAPLINDPDDRVQLAAIDAELTFFLADRVGSVRVLGIGGGSRSRAQEAFETGPLVRAAAPAPPVVIDRLISAMRDENPRVQFDAVHAIGFIAEAPLSDPQARLLAAELDHYDPIIRAASARVLARLKATAAADQLAVALLDSNAVVRLYATEALGLLRDTDAAPALRTQLTTARGDMIATTLLALARIGAAADVDLFRARLTDRAAPVRRAAVEGLGRAADQASLPVIEEMFKSERAADVRLAAAYALQRLGQVQTHVIASMLVMDDQRAQARDYLMDIGRESIPGIGTTLAVAKDSQHRADLVQLVGYLGTPEDAPLVEAFLQDRDLRVRRAAVQAVARLRR